MTRLPDSARGRWPRALVLLFLLVLAVPGPLAAQDSPGGLSLAPADDLSLSPAERPVSKRSCPGYRLLPGASPDCEPWMASADLTTGAPLQPAKADAGLPFVWETSESNRRLASALIPLTAWGLVAANSLVGYHDHNFHINHEDWFTSNTRDGGADKASHFADYFVVANLFSDVYRMLGYSENAARWWGVGLAITTGLANEISDGYTRHGFSWEDLAMDAAGAGTAALVSATRTQDLLGVRTSHVGGATYTHDVYAADFKLSGLGQRLGVNLGPLRWLLVSVTYGTKGYRVTPPIELQRQVGFEIGLNLQQILNDVGVKKDTWWGYPLHLVADNVRFPYTAFGMRVDLNHGKWHGPNNGNFD